MFNGTANMIIINRACNGTCLCFLFRVRIFAHVHRAADEFQQTKSYGGVVWRSNILGYVNSAAVNRCYVLTVSFNHRIKFTLL